jgi:2-dehydropantoate 2-reductase
MKMKIYILGAGSLGTVFGGALFMAGQDVTLLCHSQKQADLINQDGLNMQTGEITQKVAIPAAKSGDNLPTPDLIIVVVKSQHTRTAIQSVLPNIGAQTIVVSLQNGMGHEETISQFIPKSQILGGKTYVGGVRLSANRVIAGYQGKLNILGEFNGVHSERVQKIANIFRQAGLTTQVSTNIYGAMWDKLFINVATGAVSAISGLCYGDLYQSKGLETVAISAVNEAIAIAKARQIEITIPEGATAWKMASAGLPYDFKPSMLQSLENGHRTEIDFINDYVVQKGIEMGIPTPFNQTLVACLKGIEQKKFGMTPKN